MDNFFLNSVGLGKIKGFWHHTQHVDVVSETNKKCFLIFLLTLNKVINTSQINKVLFDFNDFWIEHSFLEKRWVFVFNSLQKEVFWKIWLKLTVDVRLVVHERWVVLWKVFAQKWRILTESLV